MRERNERNREGELCLSEDEAMGLLDLVIMAPGEMTPEQRMAVEKLSEFCRQFLRPVSDTILTVSTTSSLPSHVVIPTAYAA